MTGTMVANTCCCSKCHFCQQQQYLLYIIGSLTIVITSLSNPTAADVDFGNSGSICSSHGYGYYQPLPANRCRYHFCQQQLIARLTLRLPPTAYANQQQQTSFLLTPAAPAYLMNKRFVTVNSVCQLTAAAVYVLLSTKSPTALVLQQQTYR